MDMESEEFCPKCGTRMKKSNEPLRIRGTYVGSYESMSCPVCKYYYFTDKEYDQALYDARSLGVVGPPLPEIGSAITSEKLNIGSIFHVDKISTSVFEPDKDKRTHALVELPPVTISHDVLVSTGLDAGK
jgi:hypothetical protein